MLELNKSSLNHGNFIKIIVFTFQQHGQHRNVHESDDNCEAKAEIKESFGGVIAHMQKKSTNHNAEKNVHENAK